MSVTVCWSSTRWPSGPVRSFLRPPLHWTAGTSNMPNWSWDHIATSYVGATRRPKETASSLPGPPSVRVVRSDAERTLIGMSLFYDTLSMELLALIPTGNLKEFKAVSHKLDRREKQSLISNLPATQWIWRQPLSRGKISKPWPREPAACHPPSILYRKAET